MKKIRAYIILLGIPLLLIPGCSNEKKVLRQQVAAQADSLSVLRQDLRVRTDSLQNIGARLDQIRARLDSITSEVGTRESRIGRLNSQLRQAREANTNLQESLDRSRSVNDSLKAYYSNTLADTSNALAQLRSDISSKQQTIVRGDTLLAQIRPWYMKWRRDAHRNFLQVLFGSGKAEKPPFPEPDLGLSQKQ